MHAQAINMMCVWVLFVFTNKTITLQTTWCILLPSKLALHLQAHPFQPFPSLSLRQGFSTTRAREATLCWSIKQISNCWFLWPHRGKQASVLQLLFSGWAKDGCFCLINKGTFFSKPLFETLLVVLNSLNDLVRAKSHLKLSRQPTTLAEEKEASEPTILEASHWAHSSCHLSQLLLAISFDCLQTASSKHSGTPLRSHGGSCSQTSSSPSDYHQCPHSLQFPQKSHQSPHSLQPPHSSHTFSFSLQAHCSAKLWKKASSAKLWKKAFSAK